jgi:hypothetical protein
MLRRGLLVALSVIGGSVLAVGTVHADQPERFEYEFFDEFVDTEVCAAEPWQFDVPSCRQADETTRPAAIPKSAAEVAVVVTHLAN